MRLITRYIGRRKVFPINAVANCDAACASTFNFSEGLLRNDLPHAHQYKFFNVYKNLNNDYFSLPQRNLSIDVNVRPMVAPQIFCCTVNGLNS